MGVVTFRSFVGAGGEGVAGRDVDLALSWFSSTLEGELGNLFFK